MRKLMLFLVAAALGLLLTANVVSAFSFPVGPIELDLDNYTRLYYSENGFDDDGNPVLAGDVVALGQAPAEGMISKTFLTFNDISPTLGYGGPDLAPVWVGGDNGEWLYGVEKNIIISDVSTDETRFYFNSVDTLEYELEIYVSTIPLMTFLTGAGYLVDGPTMFGSIYNALVTPELPYSTTLLLGGDYARSTFTDAQDGILYADAGVEVPLSFLGGDYINQDTTPFGLGVNCFMDIKGGRDAYLVEEGLYGNGPNPYESEEYDLAIQNIRLNSELNAQGWIVSDDGIRMAIIPEPATMLLLGSGLIGLAGLGRRKRSSDKRKA